MRTGESSRWGERAKERKHRAGEQANRRKKQSKDEKHRAGEDASKRKPGKGRGATVGDFLFLTGG